MKNNLENIRAETDEKVKQAYLALHNKPYSKESIQDLEEQLSKNIYDAEIQIQKSRRLTPDLAEEYYRRRTILKRIADGLAWIILDFNQLEIRSFSNNHSPGFMAGKKGYKTERHIIEAFKEASEIKWAIQCDITNVLRINDVIAVKTDGERLLNEAKGSKSGSGRATKQKSRAKKAIDFIETGIFNDYIKDSALLHAFEVPITYEHYWEELEYLSREAIRNGMANKVLDDAFVLCVVDKSRYSQKDAGNTTQKTGQSRTNQNLTMRILGEHMSQDSQILPIIRFPLTLFPIDTSLGLKFVLGELDAMCVLNLDIMTKKIKDAGLNIIVDKDKQHIIKLSSKKIFSIKDGWDRILLELITIPSFIELVILTTQQVNNNFSDT